MLNLKNTKDNFSTRYSWRLPRIVRHLGQKHSRQWFLFLRIRINQENGLFFPFSSNAAANEYFQLSDEANPSGLVLLTAGGVAGLFYWALVYPADAVKTLLQTDASNVADRKYKFLFLLFFLTAFP